MRMNAKIHRLSVHRKITLFNNLVNYFQKLVCNFSIKSFLVEI